MRTILAALLIPFAALAAPLAATSAADAAAPGTLNVSATSVTTGATLTASGTFRKAYAGRKVAIQVQSSGAWKTVATHKATAKGAYSITVTAPAKTGIMRLRAYVTKQKLHASSPVRTIKVTTPPPPVMKVGQSFSNGSWSFTFGATDTDAWPELQAADEDNVAPAAGWAYVMVPVTFHNDSDQAGDIYLPNDIELLGSDVELYTDTTDDDSQSCGTVPDDWALADPIAVGASVTKNVCAVVPTSALDDADWVVLNEDAEDLSLVNLF